MTQATVQAQKEQQKEMMASKKAVKRPSSLPKAESKKRAKAKSEATEPAAPAVPEPTPQKYGGTDGMTIMYTEEYVTLQKKKATYRMYPRLLKAIQDKTMEFTTAMQDDTTLSIALPGDVTATIERYMEGLYVLISKPLSNGFVWSISLKFAEFSYLLENLDDLLAKFKPAEYNPKSAQGRISAASLFDEAVKIFASLAEEEITKLKAVRCQGCAIDHPSQLQHDTCMVTDTSADIEGLYLEEAIANVTHAKFGEVLNKTTKDKHLVMTPKMLWTMCSRMPLLQRVKDIVLAPLRLREEIAELVDDETTTAVEGLLDAAAH